MGNVFGASSRRLSRKECVVARSGEAEFFIMASSAGLGARRQLRGLGEFGTSECNAVVGSVGSFSVKFSEILN